MRSGDLRHRATLQQDSSNDDDPECDFTGDALVTNYACSIVCTTGQETWRGRKLESRVDYVVVGRVVDGVTPDMRLSITGGLYNGKTLNIDTVKTVQMRGKPSLEMYCTELVN